MDLGPLRVFQGGPTPGLRVFLAGGFERCELLGCRRLLMSGLPAIERLAVDALARGILADVDAALGGRFAIPVRKAIAAETRDDHEIDVLRVLAGVEMPEQPAEDGGFELGGGIGQGDVPGRCVRPMLFH